MGELISLNNEVSMMNELLTETVVLIHATSVVVAIKRLIQAYDIIDLNLDVQFRFQSVCNGPIWDRAALSDLWAIQRELCYSYRETFRPVKQLDCYTEKMGKLFRSIDLRALPR